MNMTVFIRDPCHMRTRHGEACLVLRRLHRMAMKGEIHGEACSKTMRASSCSRGSADAAGLGVDDDSWSRPKERKIRLLMLVWGG
ncbi:hypothetical protein LZ30DRAFT_457103 [Colletotrichum cereale]|nr:hypothetical protein LZ30DRAFT_457103 [Colletotrichum cereale]